MSYKIIAEASGDHYTLSMSSEEFSYGFKKNSLPIELIKEIIYCWLPRENLSSVAALNHELRNITIDMASLKEVRLINGFIAFLIDNLIGTLSPYQKETLSNIYQDDTIRNAENLLSIKFSILNFREKILNVLKTLSDKDLSYVKNLSASLIFPNLFKNIFELAGIYKKIDEVKIIVKVPTGVRNATHSFFPDLPNETVLGIFQYLNPRQLFNLPPVDKRFNELCKDGQIWSPVVRSYGWRKNENQSWREVAIEQSQLFLRGNILTCTPTVESITLQGLASIGVNLGPQMVGGFYKCKRDITLKVAIWNLETGQRLHVFDRREGILISLCESYLTAVTKDSTILFKINGTVAKFPIPGGAANVIASHPNFLAFALNETITVYDSQTGEAIDTLIDENRESNLYVNLIFFKDRLLSRERNGKVRIWDYSTGKGRLVSEFKIQKGRNGFGNGKHLSDIRALDEKIMVEQKDSDIYVRELEKGAIIYQFQIKKNNWERYGISAAINGNIIAITSQDMDGLSELYLANINEKRVKKFSLSSNDRGDVTTGACWIGQSLFVVYDNSKAKKIVFSI